MSLIKKFKHFPKISLVPAQFSVPVARSWVRRGGVFLEGGKADASRGPMAALAMAATRREVLQEGGKAALKNGEEGGIITKKHSSRGRRHLAG